MEERKHQNAVRWVAIFFPFPKQKYHQGYEKVIKGICQKYAIITTTKFDQPIQFRLNNTINLIKCQDSSFFSPHVLQISRYSWTIKFIILNFKLTCSNFILILISLVYFQWVKEEASLIPAQASLPQIDGEIRREWRENYLAQFKNIVPWAKKSFLVSSKSLKIRGFRKYRMKIRHPKNYDSLWVILGRPYDLST